MDKNFKELGIKENILVALDAMGIVKPTEVQEKTIVPALEGKNIIAQSQTGTGKTLAYLLPMMEKINCDSKELQGLILAPTHELTMQIHNTILDLKKDAGINCNAASLVGSGNITRQIEKLKSKPQIATGSTGRVLDLIKRKKLKVHSVNFLVIDEFDKLLDKDSIADIKAIIKSLDNKVQIIMVSATTDENTLETAKSLMNDAEIIKVSSSDLNINPNITHEFFLCDPRKKVEFLRKVVHWERAAKTLVFVNNNYDVEMTLDKLKYHSINCDSICGNISKEDRKNAIEGFRRGKINVLIASDVGARGLDIKGITHVVNLDMPKSEKDYVHRAGRVARGENTGKCISLVAPREFPLIEKYEKIFNIKMTEKVLYKGQILDYED
ncbi:MAG: DEAD/DEAH box helicase [Clostridium sp.]|uniref:DEAD/DEAH box helicase n=1 Tax=Clostridium sp. TaxID=1506 RepID=UPI002A87CEA6|nr:DEAD/DEAH box helicase [Clostridium sp.]MDY5098052.1 DEAD/DEAH box helicase [Clostridium sp.]